MFDLNLIKYSQRVFEIQTLAGQMSGSLIWSLELS